MSNKGLDFDALKEAGFFTIEDATELRGLLGNKSLRRALGEILRLRDETDKITNADLLAPQGLIQAAQLQGIVLGISRTVEQLISLSEVEENVDEKPIEP